MDKERYSETVEDSKEFSIIEIAIIGLIIITIWIFSGFFVYDNFSDWPTRGQFGDSFGLINSLFSGLTFLGLILTIYLQRREIKVQLKELKETNDAAHALNSISRKQTNVNIFFGLLSNHRNFIESIVEKKAVNNSITGDMESLKGDFVLEERIKTFKSKIEKIERFIDSGISDAIVFSEINRLPIFDSKLLSVYRSLFTIFDFIYENIEDKDVYFQIFFDTINDNERYVFKVYSYFNALERSTKVNKSGFKDFFYKNPNFIDLEFMPNVNFSKNIKGYFGVDTTFEESKYLHIQNNGVYEVFVSCIYSSDQFGNIDKSRMRPINLNVPAGNSHSLDIFEIVDDFLFNGLLKKVSQDSSSSGSNLSYKDQKFGLEIKYLEKKYVAIITVIARFDSIKTQKLDFSIWF